MTRTAEVVREAGRGDRHGEVPQAEADGDRGAGRLPAGSVAELSDTGGATMGRPQRARGATNGCQDPTGDRASNEVREGQLDGRRG